MKMPQEIAIHFKKCWLEFIKKAHPGREFEENHLKDRDVERFEAYLERGLSGYSEAAQEISKAEKLAPDFWKRVVLGDYDLFYETFTKTQLVEQDGIKFMI